MKKFIFAIFFALSVFGAAAAQDGAARDERLLREFNAMLSAASAALRAEFIERSAAMESRFAALEARVAAVEAKMDILIFMAGSAWVVFIGAAIRDWWANRRQKTAPASLPEQGARV